jgi:flagellin
MDDIEKNTREVFMFTAGMLTATYGRIATFYKTNENDLTDTLNRVASGKRVKRPQDNIPDYFHASQFNKNLNPLQNIRTGVSEMSGLLDIAVGAGEQVFRALSNMQALMKDYYDPNTSAEDKDAMKADFTQLTKEAQTVIDTANYDGTQIIQDSSASPLKTVNLDPHDFSQTFSVSFNSQEVAAPSVLTLGTGTQSDEENALQQELDKAGNFLAHASAYKRGIRAQYNLLTRKIDNSQEVISNTTSADITAEIAKAVKQSMQHQAALSMMAQANTTRESIIRLLQF